ncbi:UDP-galactopyranose mutase [Bordetella sputigena]|uniref:UDP-galactopyranose mutase n=1 Tax=Bordetella sputigena TaxID=1416810 RepID=UPI0039F028D7
MNPQAPQRVDNATARPSTRAAGAGAQQSARPDLICFSHLRWHFVYQRPQHLLSRFARSHRVYYFEEPVGADDGEARLDRHVVDCGVTILVPRLPAGMDPGQTEATLRRLLDQVIADEAIQPAVLWYYTPIALGFSAHLAPAAIVYDCMDELSAFRGAPPELTAREAELLTRADVVFTGGHSLYEAKRERHRNVHAFPSSVDIEHFKRARIAGAEPADQAGIPHPRLGFYGVLDERLDTGLVARIAAARPDWQLVFVGPVVKIDPATLPRADNIHYLGPKAYGDLPAYLSGWDAALMPFALNESTRFISPTKTPEFIAAGKPVVSTRIVDVERSYGACPLVRIADDADGFVAAAAAALRDAETPAVVAGHADRALAGMSWDRTWRDMSERVAEVSRPRPAPVVPMRGRSAAAKDDARQAGRPSPASRSSTARYDYLVVGAGFAGSVLAERLAAGLGQRVLVIDRRPHIGGNAYDHFDDAGVLVHRYGPHIFHTNADQVVKYLSRFTGWRPYEHRVLASVDDMLVPMPINLTTLSTLYGQQFTSASAQAFLAERAETHLQIRTAEDMVVSQVGRDLYERFFRGYTRKQWGLDPAQLDKSVTARVPTRTSHDDRYFTDRFQAMPDQGYTRMFERMLDHPNIDVCLGTDYRTLRGAVPARKLVYTGPIDEYFDYCHGALPYRSLVFRHETLGQERFQAVGVVNYPAEEVPYTRITEYKHLTGQRHPCTSLTYEYPSAEGDPYYPVPRPENAELYRRYQALADARPDVLFVGRLATYRYYNMDQVVAQSLAAYGRIEAEHRAGTSLPAQAAVA